MMTDGETPVASGWLSAGTATPFTNRGLLGESDEPLALRPLAWRTTLFDGQVRLSGPVGLPVADSCVETPATATVTGWPGSLTAEGNPERTVPWPFARANDADSGRKMTSAPSCGATVAPAERRATCAAR
jgi:hypothetical protein